MRAYPRRRQRKRPPMRSGQKRLCLFLAGLLLIAAAVLRLDYKLRPAIVEIAAAELETVISNAIDQVCIKDAEDGTTAYSKLVQLQYDDQGKLLGLTTDMASLNTLRADMAREIAAQLKQVEKSAVMVPLGTASGVTLFSGLGPEIPVQVLSLESISSRFESSFTAAGINQTKHQIRMVISVNVILLLPVSTYEKTFTSRITVAESILMGEVPSHYSYFSQFDTAKEASDAQKDYSAE